MHKDFGYRDLILLSVIFIFVSVVFLFLNFPQETPSPEIETPRDYSPDIIIQNQMLRKDLEYANYTNDLLRKNLTTLSNIIDQQNLIIRRMHERINTIYELGTEKKSPSDRIPAEKIQIEGNKVIIQVEQPMKGSITNSTSELPLLNEYSSTIEITPASEADIHIGDIIVYHSLEFSLPIMHRVVSQGYDIDGWFIITQGDNNFSPDDEKVRFFQVRSIVVGIIY
ncbi:MAG: hypothetical protein ABIJ21_04205 [Nanoarchaeota archaeon]